MKKLVVETLLGGKEAFLFFLAFLFGVIESALIIMSYLRNLIEMLIKYELQNK